MAAPRTTFHSRMLDAYYVFVLMLSTTACVSLFVNLQDSANVAAGSPIFKILWGTVYVVSIVRVVRMRHQAIAMLKMNKALIFLLLLGLFSAAWSIAPLTTLHYAATVLLCTFFSIDFSLSVSIRRQLELIRTAFVILLALSVIVQVLFPGFIPTAPEEADAWHGLWAFKNDFGRIVCFGTIAWLTLTRSFALRCFIFACGITLTILSKSVSAVGYTILLTAILVALSVFKWRPKPRLAGMIGLVVLSAVCAIFVAQNWANILASVDKDPHLTGRFDLWRLSLKEIEKRPLLGYGYMAFWNYDSQPARRIREAVNWPEAPHAHNAYIDVTLSTGLIGLSVYCLAILIVFMNACRYFMSGNEDYRRWPLVYVAFVASYQLTEGGIVVGNSVMSILFVSMAFSLSLVKQESAEVQEAPQLAASAA
jgi:exopolysaccharide production protein ExoQ